MRHEDIKTVAIIGTGFIGVGWAHLFSRAGLETRLYDSNPAVLKVALSRLQQELALFTEAGVIDSVRMREALERIELCEDLAQACSGVQYVQECVPEDLSTKQAVFEALDRLTASDVILASSVSSLPMTEIAERAHHPERCVVAHPTNPPHIIPLVEVAAGAKTSPQVVQTTYDFLEHIGQKPIQCREVFGYVLNRLQFALVQEAFYLAREGVATPTAIDRCVTEGLGLRWALTGPFMVEELNAPSIEEDLRKYGPAIQQLVAALGRWDGPTEEDVHMASNGVRQILDGKTRDEVAAWRTKAILRLRALKQEP